MTLPAGSAISSVEDCVLRLLVERGVVRSDLAADAEAAETEGGPAALDALVRRSETTRAEIDAAALEAFGLETVDLSNLYLSATVQAAVPRDLAIRYGVFPLGLDGNEVRIAVSDPFDTEAPDGLGHLLNRPVICRYASRLAIERAIERSYPTEAAVEAEAAVAADREETGTRPPFEKSHDDTEAGDAAEAPIIRYVHEVIAEGLRRRASDIHLEPLERSFRIRYRVDGVLQEVDGPPKRLQPTIVSRIKLMADISIAEKRIPQDGRIRFEDGQSAVDLRVSSLPTAYGESIVMRILDKESLRLGLPELGFFSDDQAVFERTIALPDGIFLVTGPTGSGKSTTLYTALNHINHPDRKIITVEDPVEYELSGINQVQVRREVGMTFSAALRSMLRQAPNIIMVGEIRDLETAEIAVNASLTGHMVFSTLHTNDAASAISRLVDIGIKPFLVSAAVRAVMAQRLVRRVCPECREPHAPDEHLLQSIGIGPAAAASADFARGAGCSACRGTGFRGRIGIFELFTVSQQLSRMIYEEATLVQLRERAREAGMRTMREDGRRKVLAGLTTPEEILRATVADAA